MKNNNHLQFQQTPQVSEELLSKTALLSPYAQIITHYNQEKYLIAFINKAFEDLTGYCSQDVKNRDISFIFGNSSTLKTLENFRDVIRHGKQLTDVVSSYKKDGSHFHNELTITPIQNQFGEITHLSWIMRDISHFVYNEEKLMLQIEEQDKRFAAYLKNSTEALWRIDFSPPISLFLSHNDQVNAVYDNGVFTEANNNTAKEYGYERGIDIIGTPLKKFLTKDNVGNGLNILQLVSEKFELEHCITNEKGAGGENIVVLNNISPHITDGLVHYIWGASHVITDLVSAKEDAMKSQEELHLQKLTLERKNIALSEIIGQIEIEKKEFKDQIMANIEQVILPTLNKITDSKNNLIHVEYLKLALLNLTSSFGRKINHLEVNLSPREIQICNLVKNGMSNKEIAAMLNISLYTVEVHRRNLREKLGLKNKKQNLRTFLITS